YIIDCGLASYMQAGRLSEGVAAVERETEGRTRAAEYFLARLDWDLLVVVYSLPDVWQHYRWAALHAAPDRAGRELIYDGYRTLDRHLARLLRHLPPGGLAVICSDHGFGPLCGTRDQLNNWLASQGLLCYQAGSWRSTRARLGGALLNAARRRVSFRLRQQALAALPPLRRAVETRLRVGGIDWAQTRAYAALDHQELWINVRGRQPAGCVDPDDYEHLCKQLAVALRAWCDEQGRPYINAVHTRPYADAAADDYLPPDLLLEWNPAAAQPNLHPLVSGDHDPEGALIVAGPGVHPQRLADCSLLDIAPLALYGLGVPIPGSIQGRIPEELC
ncbi:MAG: hypothetical protein EOM24_11520, partial [Chloroflexia bacterium]|nr:hypothetical protein [Chloroflexia bacterium]